MMHMSIVMGAMSQPLPFRPGSLNLAAQDPASRCKNHSSSISSVRQSQCTSTLTLGVRQQLQASRPVAGGLLQQPMRRHAACRAASADEQPAPFEEARSASDPGGAQLQQQVAEYGEAVAQRERAAFLAAQNQLRQQQATQPRQQQAAGTQQLQGGAAMSAQDGRMSIGTNAATPAAAATFGGNASASAPANVLADSPSAASGSQQPEVSAPQAASGGAGKLDMAAAVREKLARAAEYRKVAHCKPQNTCAVARS
jgi:hypothetical protein